MPVAGLALLWIVISDADEFPGGICGIEFGVEYGGGLEARNRSFCTDHMIPGDGWPNSGSGVSLAWGDPQYPGESIRLGYFIISSGDIGWMRC